MWHRKATASPFRCSFCHKPKGQVEQLLAGPRGSTFATPAWIVVSRLTDMRLAFTIKNGQSFLCLEQR